MGENHQNKTGSKPVATEDKLLESPLSPKEQKMLMYIRIKGFLKAAYKRTGFASKTLWDWLQLLAMLAIPIVVALVSISFSTQQDTNNQRQHAIELQIAANQQQDATLDSYIDHMTNLLLNVNLHKSKPGDEVRNVARAQTLNVLRRLDPARKVTVLRFLFEANLMSVISLDDAELSWIRLIDLRPRVAVDIRYFSVQYANLPHAYIENFQVEQSAFNYTDLSDSIFIRMKVTFSDFNHVNFIHATITDTELSNCRLVGADLSSANLNNVILKNTDLTDANLKGANLSNVDLRGAKVTSEQLALAKSLKGTIMPDGSTHP
jgi:uncharacterized protein YjbI with pentapeptide repeats